MKLMKLTTLNNNFTTLFLPLTMLLGLLLLAGHATAEFCCFVGGCGGNTHCNPCRAMTSCGQYDPCNGEGTCANAEEGVLSPESITAGARTLRQGAVEWRKAEDLLDGRKSKEIFEHGWVKKLLKKHNANEEVVEDREPEGVAIKRTAYDLVKKDTVKATVKDRKVEGAFKNVNAENFVKKTNDELHKKDSFDGVVKKDNGKDVLEDRQAMTQANANDPYEKRNVGEEGSDIEG